MILPPETLEETGERGFLRRLRLGAQLCQLGYGAAAPGLQFWPSDYEHVLTVRRGSAAIVVIASDDGRHLILVPVGSNNCGDWWCSNIPSVIRVHFPWAPAPPDFERPMLRLLRSIFRPDVCYGWGFLGQLRAIREPLIRSPIFQAAYDAAEQVWIVGHSLGGAVAMGLRASLPESYDKPTRVLTYGAPRTWNKIGARWLVGTAQSKTVTESERGSHRLRALNGVFSVRHCPGGLADLVTRVPPRRHGAAHAGLPVVVSESGVEVGELAWHRILAEQQVGELAVWRILSRLHRSVRAHRLDGLIADLEAAERRLGRGHV